MDPAQPLPNKPQPTGRKFSKRVVVWLVLASIILAIISGLIFRSITQLLRSSVWVAHSYQVLDTLDLTQAYFIDAEAAERGYVATCKPSMITPFRHDLPQIYAKLAALRALTGDNEAQRERIALVGRTMTSELERMSVIITTTLNGHQAQAEQAIMDPQNMSATQQVASALSAMEKEERALLNHRLHNVQIFARMTLISCAAGVAAIFAILGFVFWLIRREIRRRESTEAALQQKGRALESSLQELHRYNASARAVGLLGELLQTCRSTDEALTITARHMRELMPNCRGAIALFNNSRDSLEVTRSLEPGNTADGALFSPLFRADDCWALRRGRAHFAAPESFEPCCAHLEGPELFFLCVPMIAQSETLGVFTLAQSAAFGEVDRQTIQTISEQLSLALANLKLQESLRNQSLRDPLTGLFNRRYMGEAIARELARATRQSTPLAVAMVDIDHFKRFNDGHGHEGGDVLLAAFGRLLGGMSRDEDIVCRYGGEEFALILPGTDAETAHKRLDQIRLAVRQLQVSNHGQSLGSVSMSAGVAVFPRDGSSGDSLIAAADVALYEAKRAGRDRVMAAGKIAVRTG
jgi:diguanylate cyclase (GGDEF)-like protein